MTLTVGTRLGSHEITGPLGKGGMGEVYRARDLKLKREVAIKILPDEFSRDEDRVSRFQREAEVLASLNHPNIASIYHLEEHNDSRYLVLELVDGETLAERISRGPILLEDALTIAKQICEALEAAHERGIVHRDLKPANVKITPDGKVKVLDFGLAKALDGTPSSLTVSNSPTVLSGTIGGVIVGTAAYMSPEQARGKAVDSRTDNWAFGCILYEMLTGKQAFAGETITDILARVLEGQPKWEALPAETPSSIRFLLEAALNKDPKQRLQHIGDAKLLLNRPATLEKSRTVTAGVRRGRGGWFVATAAVALAVAASLPAALYFMRTPAELPVMRFEMPAPGIVGNPNGVPVISPDGQRIAYVATNSGKSAIWIRAIGSLAAQPLPGTENASSPFWAPDSHRLAFYADGKLKKIDVAGGGVQTLCDAVLNASGAWNKDGVILFGAFLAKGPGIVRVSDAGGEPALVAAATDPSSIVIQFVPRFLPDGRHFLFHTVANDLSGSVYFGSLDSKSVTRVMGISDFGPDGNDSQVEYAQGYLLFSRGKTLLAQPFDSTRGALTGEPATVAENVGRLFSVSATGVLAYRTAAAQSGQSAPARLLWFDRKGKAAGEISTPSTVGDVRLFRDGRIALDNGNIGNNTDIWVLDARGVPNKVTADNPNYDGYPVWSPDGVRLVFASSREKNGTSKLYQKLSNGLGAPEPLLMSDVDVADFPVDWAKGGIVFQRYKLATLQMADIWFLSMPDRKPSLYLHNGFINTQAQLSSDGRYLAYATNESGSFQIVVQTFPDRTGKWTVTAQGGTEPLWRADGRELYYLAPNGKIMATAVKTDNTFEAGQPSELFQTALLAQIAPSLRRYAVSSDGQRFLIASGSNTALTSADSIPITAVVNWSASLHKK